MKISRFVDVQFMHTFRPERGQAVDKPWTNRWNDLSRAWNGLSRAFQKQKICCKIVDPAPKRGQQFGFQSGYS